MIDFLKNFIRTQKESLGDTFWPIAFVAAIIIGFVLWNVSGFLAVAFIILLLAAVVAYFTNDDFQQTINDWMKSKMPPKQ